MKKTDDQLNGLFEKFENEWDIQVMDSNHEVRFLDKLKVKKSKKSYFVPLSIAASIVIMLGVSLFYNTSENPKNLKFASKEVKQTDSIFTVLIEHQLDKIHEKKSPENEKIISDALKQMKTFDSDYEKIIKELAVNGESKQIIYAMISNLQTRISFLQSVLMQIEKNEKRKINIDEKTT